VGHFVLGRYMMGHFVCAPNKYSVWNACLEMSLLYCTVNTTDQRKYMVNEGNRRVLRRNILPNLFLNCHGLLGTGNSSAVVCIYKLLGGEWEECQNQLFLNL
jgi:hypothetical protein